MRVLRVVLAVLGLAALGWGGSLLVPLLLGSPGDAVSLLAWLGGGPVLHDLLLAPAVALLGTVIVRALSPRWRGPVTTGLVVTGTLGLLSVPLLWRENSGPPNPGLHDRPYLAGLAAAVAVVWIVVLLCGVTHRRTKSSP
ncbi:hypothetical protein F0L68_36820 [Solihabitans fulvus]|uniref:Uncharacterized protein n=1 Tax=Solihabitans fulvus TaxID=1892852 RepID=A0A5B2WMF7_9PSEU|nr:hypothetical protein [Solihabitans fulvus]KAA2252118.1 hypothetical protein F0L68_36820 [Solihabitans fulvus]